MKKSFYARKITVCAILIAASIILRLLGFPQNGTFRIEFGFLPIAVIGTLFGPLYSGISYLIADILGTFCTGMVPLPTISLCKIAMGAIYGFAFYKKERSFLRIFLCVTVTIFLVDLILMPFALHTIMGSKSIFAILYDRALASIVNYPLRVITLWVSFKYLNPIIDKEAEKNGHN